MKKDQRLNVNSVDYIPMYDKDLGFTEKQMLEGEGNPYFEKEYERVESEFKRKNIERIALMEQRKRARREKKAMSHWFNVMDKFTIEKLIDDSRSVSKQVFEELRKAKKEQWLSDYNEMLRYRVDCGKMTIRPATTDQIRRFPEWSPRTDSLFGSAHAFYRLWAHVFPSERASKARSINVKK